MRGIGRSLHTLWTIFKHEFALFFVSPIVYLVGAIWLLLAGFFFVIPLGDINQGFAEPSMQYMLQPMVFLMLFVAPALTMRLVSEEVRAGTHELLLTSPIRDWEVIVGKWLGVWAVFTVFILITLLYPFLLVWRGSPEQGLIITGYLGLWLLSGATFAIGILASSLTQYQPVAFMIGMGFLIFFWLSDAVPRLVTNNFMADVLGQLSLTAHYRNMVQRALLDPVDIAYFVGLTAIFLFLAAQILSTRRWRA
jgi:ABC-2 type transport system permease protein